MTDYFIGLMSGTSLDGIDAAIVAFSECGFSVAATRYQPYAAEFRDRLRRICFTESIRFEELGRLDAELGELFGTCAGDLVQDAGLTR